MNTDILIRHARLFFLGVVVWASVVFLIVFGWKAIAVAGIAGCAWGIGYIIDFAWKESRALYQESKDNEDF